MKEEFLHFVWEILELFSYKIIIVAKKMFNLQHWKTTDKK